LGYVPAAASVGMQPTGTSLSEQVEADLRVGMESKPGYCYSFTKRSLAGAITGTRVALTLEAATGDLSLLVRMLAVEVLIQHRIGSTTMGYAVKVRTKGSCGNMSRCFLRTRSPAKGHSTRRRGSIRGRRRRVSRLVRRSQPARACLRGVPSRRSPLLSTHLALGCTSPLQHSQFAACYEMNLLCPYSCKSMILKGL